MSDQQRISIGSKLKEVREYLKISQDEAANAANVSRSAISLIESGQRKLDSVELLALAKLYQRPVKFFTGEEETKQTEDISLLARNFSSLSDSDKEELLQFAEFLATRSKREK